MKYNVCILLFASCLQKNCAAQHTKTGQVITENGRPLAGVSVATDDNVTRALTDSAGNYSFVNGPGLIYLNFSYTGYLQTRILMKGSAPVVRMYRMDGLLTEAIVRSFESNRSLKNTPAAVSIISKADMQRYGSNSLLPAVNNIPGVKMDERSPGSYRLGIRGNILRSTFGVRNIKIYWNGIPLTDANGTTYLNQLDASNIDRIEILKGPAGSMYGSGTAGVVLMSSEFDTVKEKSMNLRISGGSYGALSAAGSFASTGKRYTARLSYAHQQSDGYRQQSRMRRDGINFTGRLFLNSKQQLLTNILYSDLFYQTPGGLTLTDQEKNPKQARPAAGAFPGAVAQQAAIYLKTLYAGFSHETNFNKKWSNTTALYISNTDFRNPTIRNFEKKKEQGVGLRSVTQYKDELFTGIFGGEYQYGNTRSQVYKNAGGAADSLRFTDDINARQFNIFLQGTLNIADFFMLNAGISYNNFHYDLVKTVSAPGKKQYRNFKPGLVPRIAILKTVNKAVTFHAAVSKGFSPPTIEEVRGGNDLFNIALNAETGLNYEAGFKAGLFKSKLWFEATTYLFYLKNTIVSRRDSAGGDYFINAGKTKQNGTELSINFLAVVRDDHFFRRVKVWAAYTNIYARFTNYQQGAVKFDGNKITGTAPVVFSGGCDVNTGIKMYANLSYNYTAAIPLNDANTFFGRTGNLGFAKLGYKTNLLKNITADIFVSYERSFNNPYSLGYDLNAAAGRYFNPSSPENMYSGIQIKFIL